MWTLWILIHKNCGGRIIYFSNHDAALLTCVKCGQTANDATFDRYELLDAMIEGTYLLHLILKKTTQN
jgi:hypothetical protein